MRTTVWGVRIFVTALFTLVMLGVRTVVHAAVDSGPLAWLALMTVIFWSAIKLENAGRRSKGRPLYSWDESRELITPLTCFVCILIIAVILR
jgi:hypothetical protein